jgi:hypothetical protein
MDMQHFKDMQNYMQHGHAARTRSKDAQHGYAARTSSMDKRYGHAE